MYALSQNDFISDKNFFLNSVKFLEENEDCGLVAHNYVTKRMQKLKNKFDF